MSTLQEKISVIREVLTEVLLGTQQTEWTQCLKYFSSTACNSDLYVIYGKEKLLMRMSRFSILLITLIYMILHLKKSFRIRLFKTFNTVISQQYRYLEKPDSQLQVILNYDCSVSESKIAILYQFCFIFTHSQPCSPHRIVVVEEIEEGRCAGYIYGLELVVKIINAGSKNIIK